MLQNDAYIKNLFKRIYYFDYLLFRYDINELMIKHSWFFVILVCRFVLNKEFAANRYGPRHEDDIFGRERLCISSPSLTLTMSASLTVVVTASLLFVLDSLHLCLLLPKLSAAAATDAVSVQRIQMTSEINGIIRMEMRAKECRVLTHSWSRDSWGQSLPHAWVSRRARTSSSLSDSPRSDAALQDSSPSATQIFSF